MVNSTMLNSQPIRKPLMQNQKLSFGSEKFEAVECKPVQEKTSAKKGADIRKFSMINAAENFGNGLIAPVKKLIDGGVEGMLATVGSGVIIGSIISKVGRSVKIPLISAFAGIGAYKVGKGVHQVTTNRGNPEQQENAFGHMGEGTAIIGLSVLASKPAIKNSPTAVNSENMSYRQSFKQCIKETPTVLKNTWKAVDDFITNGWKDGRMVEATAYTAQLTDIFDPTNLDSLVGASVLEEAEKKHEISKIDEKINNAMTRHDIKAKRTEKEDDE